VRFCVVLVRCVCVLYVAHIRAVQNKISAILRAVSAMCVALPCVCALLYSRAAIYKAQSHRHMKHTQKCSTSRQAYTQKGLAYTHKQHILQDEDQGKQDDGTKDGGGGGEDDDEPEPPPPPKPADSPKKSAPKASPPRAKSVGKRVEEPLWEGRYAEAEVAGDGACCDSEGNCNPCPGPDEDYNPWDNLYIFPGWVDFVLDTARMCGFVLCFFVDVDSCVSRQCE
jgi:hypothetical protein